MTDEIVIANFNTLMSSAGTGYFPEVKDKILLIEEMSASFSVEERSLRQLQQMGVFDQISGLIMGKPEIQNDEDAAFSLNELLMEVVGSWGNRDYPIVSEFDCSHTVPMHTIGERAQITLEAKGEYDVTFKVLDSFVDD